MVRLNHKKFSDHAAAVGEPVGKLGAGGIEQQPRGLDRIAGDDGIFCPLPAPLAFAMVFEARHPAVLSDLNAPDHRQVADLGAGLDRPRDPGDERALFGVCRTAEFAEPAIDAGMGLAARRGNGGKRGRRPFDAERFAAARQHEPRRIHLMLTVGVAAPRRAPRIIHRPSDFQRLFSQIVIVPHLLRLDWPVDGIAEPGAGLEALRTKAQRHHLEMYGTAAHGLAAVVLAELHRILAAGDALAEPEKLLLLIFVGGEILEWPPEWAGIEGDDRKPGLGELAGERAASSASADDRKINLVLIAIAAHRDPAAVAKPVRRA